MPQKRTEKCKLFDGDLFFKVMEKIYFQCHF